jgi:hypothetical protein
MIKKSLLLIASLSVLSMPAHANWWDEEEPSMAPAVEETTNSVSQEATEVVAPTPEAATEAAAAEAPAADGGDAEPECD